MPPPLLTSLSVAMLPDGLPYPLTYLGDDLLQPATIFDKAVIAGGFAALGTCIMEFNRQMRLDTEPSIVSALRQVSDNALHVSSLAEWGRSPRAVSTTHATGFSRNDLASSSIGAGMPLRAGTSRRSGAGRFFWKSMPVHDPDNLHNVVIPEPFSIWFINRQPVPIRKLD